MQVDLKLIPKSFETMINADTYSTMRKGDLQDAVKLVDLNLSRASSSDRFFRVRERTCREFS